MGKSNLLHFFFFFYLLLLTLCVRLSTAESSWCVAGKIGVSRLESYVKSTCERDPKSCQIIRPGPIGFCYDKNANQTIRIRTQSSYLLNRVYVDMGICNDELGEITTKFPSKDTIGEISMGDLCFPPRDLSLMDILKRK